MSKTCFCVTEEGCIFQIETDMEQHDKLIYEQGYNKAIDEFAEQLKLKYPYFVEDVGFVEANKMLHLAIDEIAEQLKKEGAT